MSLRERLGQALAIAASRHGATVARAFDLVRFSSANAKVKKCAQALDIKPSRAYMLGLPAGHTCPGALGCMARADRTTGKITDGTATRFRCYAASIEALRTNVRKAMWRNFDAIKLILGPKHAPRCGLLAQVLAWQLPKNAELCRLHPHGDFFSVAYAKAVLMLCKLRPEVTFYAYSKSWHFLGQAIAELGLPDNLSLTDSQDGKQAPPEWLPVKRAFVVYSEAEARALGLEIDDDDSHAAIGTSDFALLIHGVQPKGSDAGKALAALKAAS